MARALSAPRPRRERIQPQKPRSGAKLATRARAKRAARAAATRAVTAALERELVAPAPRTPLAAREHPDPGLACLALAFLTGALASTAVALALWAGLPSAPDAPVRGRAQAAPVRSAAPPAVAHDVIVP